MSVSRESPIRILLVEDNPGDVRLLREHLSEAKQDRFELTHVATLSGGLEQLAGNRTDVVLLDLSLPDSHGLDTFVRAQAQAPGMPFVVLTGLADETVAAAALREGAQDYLVKGQVDSNLLVRSMRYAIERKRAEEALRESEERFRRLVENAADAFLVVEPEGRIGDVNQMACESLGYTREELLRLSVQDIYTPDDEAKIEEIQEQLVPGVTLTVAGTGRRKDGTTFPAEIR